MHSERRQTNTAHGDVLEIYEYKIKLLEAQLKMARWDLQRILVTLTGETPTGADSRILSGGGPTEDNHDHAKINDLTDSGGSTRFGGVQPTE